jgi:hypothetical protein
MNESFSEAKEFTMGKLILKIVVSGDGFVGGRKGESGLDFGDSEQGRGEVGGRHALER